MKAALPRGERTFGHDWRTLKCIGAAVALVLVAAPAGAADSPDLMPTTLSGPLVADAGTSVSVSWTIENQGAAEAQAPWHDAVYFSADASFSAEDPRLGFWIRASNLASGASYAETRTVTIPNVPAGDYFLLVFTDFASQVAESSEANNVATHGPFTVRTPDLTPVTLTAPTEVDAGTGMTIAWTVENHGSGEARAPWYDAAFLSTDASLDTGDRLLGYRVRTTTLPAGSGYGDAIAATMPNVPAGDYFLLLITDYASQVYEEAETNNLRVFGPMVVRTPDLVPGGISHPALGIEGSPITLTWTIENRGSGEARAPWYDVFFLSRDLTLDSGDVLLGFKIRNAPLAAGAEYTDSIVVPVPNALSGPYFVLLRTDYAGQVYEQAETNNDLSSGPFVLVNPPV